MKYKKVIILGIDCLDYYLVQKWKLNHYILDNHGFHYVGNELYTPIIWSKFITGLDTPKLGFNSKKISRIKRIKSLYYIHDLIRNILNITPNVKGHSKEQLNQRAFSSIIKRTFLKIIETNNYETLKLNEKIALSLLIKASQSERLPKSFLKETFLYTAVNNGFRVASIEFPPINDNIYSLIRNMLYFYIDAPVYERQIFLDYVWKQTKLTLDIALKKYNEYDFILWYTSYIDIASHMYYKPKNLSYMSRLYSAYKRLGSELAEFISKVRDDSIILIVSDHGFNPARQDHSHFGYWSINIDINEKPKTVLDFAKLIKNIITQIKLK